MDANLNYLLGTRRVLKSKWEMTSVEKFYECSYTALAHQFELD